MTTLQLRLFLGHCALLAVLGCGEYGWDYNTDRDNDGFGGPGQPADCAPNDPTVFPGAMELCNGRDDNCNGEVDEGGLVVYRDADGDGHGDANQRTVVCTLDVPFGYVPYAGDCNDNDPQTFLLRDGYCVGSELVEAPEVLAPVMISVSIDADLDARGLAMVGGAGDLNSDGVNDLYRVLDGGVEVVFGPLSRRLYDDDWIRVWEAPFDDAHGRAVATFDTNDRARTGRIVLAVAADGSENVDVWDLDLVALSELRSEKRAPAASSKEEAGEGSGDPVEGSGDPAEGSGDPADGSGDPIEGSGDPLEGSGDPPLVGAGRAARLVAADVLGADQVSGYLEDSGFARVAVATGREPSRSIRPFVYWYLSASSSWELYAEMRLPDDSYLYSVLLVGDVIGDSQPETLVLYGLASGVYLATVSGRLRDEIDGSALPVTSVIVGEGRLSRYSSAANRVWLSEFSGDVSSPGNVFGVDTDGLWTRRALSDDLQSLDSRYPGDWSLGLRTFATHRTSDGNLQVFGGEFDGIVASTGINTDDMRFLGTVAGSPSAVSAIEVIGDVDSNGMNDVLVRVVSSRGSFATLGLVVQ